MSSTDLLDMNSVCGAVITESIEGKGVRHTGLNLVVMFPVLQTQRPCRYPGAKNSTLLVSFVLPVLVSIFVLEYIALLVLERRVNIGTVKCKGVVPYVPGQ